MKTTARSIVACISVASALLLSACSKPVGEEFLGSWQSPVRASEHILVERNGDGFMIHDFGPSMVNGQLSERKLPATYKDGVLQVASGVGPLNFGHSTDDELIVPTMGGSVNFTRLK